MKHIKKLAVVLSILAVVAVGVVVYLALQDGEPEVASFQECMDAGYAVMESYPRQCSTPDGETFTEDIGNELEKQDLIKISNPRPNMSIESPLTITGEARGSWYFEASFSVKLLDKEGNMVAEHFAEAQDDWMTEEFVPFKATLEFEAPTSKEGTLVLEKANPSGLPENADELRVPVMFSSN